MRNRLGPFAWFLLSLLACGVGGCATTTGTQRSGSTAAPSVEQGDAPIDHIDASAMAKLLRDWGLSAQVKRTNGNDIVLAQLDALRVQVFFFDCDGSRCEDVQFHVAFDLPDRLDTRFVNSWNERFRFGRLYVDDEGDPHLEVDATLTGGVKRENIHVHFKVFLSLVQRLLQELPEHGRGVRARAMPL